MNDLKFAFRQLLKNPGFTVVAVLTLAIGIGANTAVFSVINTVLIRPLPYADPDRLVWVYQNKPQREWLQWPMGTHKFRFWLEHSRSFEQLALAGPVDFRLSDKHSAEMIGGLKVTANLCDLLGIQPLLGRAFQPEDNLPGAEPVAILSHSLWERRFSRDPQIIGKTIRQQDRSYTVVGVLPAHLTFPIGPMPAFRVVSTGDPDVWLPAVFRQPGEPEGDLGYVIGRLKQGVSPDEAQAEMRAVTQQHEKTYPETEGWSVDVVPIREQVSGHIRPALTLFFGAVLAVLLIASVNVANLLLARSIQREKEFAIRMAIGAGRSHLARQLFTESLLLSFLGGAAGMFVAFSMWKMLLTLPSVRLPRIEEIGIDAHVLAFTVGVSVFVGLVVGLVPLWRASRQSHMTQSSGKGSAEPRERSGLRNLLVSSQVALTLVLLISAGLLIQSFARVLRVETGYDRERILVMNLSLNSPGHGESQDLLVKQLLERVGGLAGVTAAGFSFGLPLARGVPVSKPFQVNGRPLEPGEDPYVNVRIRIVSSNYFATMRIPLLRGRGFSPGGTGANSEVREVILNESAAGKVFPGEDPIGRQSNFGPIIGVVADTLDIALDMAPEPQFFIEGYSAAEAFLVVRTTTATPAALKEAVLHEIAAVDKHLPVLNATTMENMVSNSLGPRRFQMSALAVFGASALLLTAIGLFGTVAYSVSQRTREIGVRVALGASRRDIMRLIVGAGMKPVLLGLACGSIGALMITRVLIHQLFGVSATDPATFWGVTLILAAVALVACWIPARRATKIDPMEALRHE